MNSNLLQAELTRCINLYSALVNLENKDGFFDINKHAETVFAAVLRLIRPDLKDLENLHSYSVNYPAIDLADFKKRIAFQITSEATARKIEKTFGTLENKPDKFKDIKKVYFIVIGDKLPYQRKVFASTIPKGISFDVREDIWGNNELLQKITPLDKSRKEQILKIFKEESFPSELLERMYSDGRKIVQLTPALLEKEDKSYYQNFFEGEPPSWEILKDYTFKRDAFNETTKLIDQRKNVLITGAGGEGKSTLLMQIALNYFDKGYNVYHVDGFESHLPGIKLKSDGDKRTLIVIDNADTIIKLNDALDYFKTAGQVNFVLGARQSDWEQADYNTTIEIPLKLLHITLRQLKTSEIDKLLELLVNKDSVSIDSKESLLKLANQSKETNFLLALMILATKGISFKDFLRSVVEKLKTKNSDFVALRALAYVICIEVLKRGEHGAIECPVSLFKKINNVCNDAHFEKLRSQLRLEANITGKLIRTRNPVIADLFFIILFEDEDGVFASEIIDYYKEIFRHCVYESDVILKDIVVQIPLFMFKRLSVDHASEIIYYALRELKRFYGPWLHIMESTFETMKVGDYSSDELTIRSFFREVYSCAPKNNMIYTYWIKMEFKDGIFGGYDEIQGFPKYSFNWICNEALKNNATTPDMFINWAKRTYKEFKQLGDIDEPYSARWILKEGLKRKKSEELYNTWATLEWKYGVIGKNYNEYFSARWLFKKGIEDFPHLSDCYVKWANYEAIIGNSIGSADSNYSANELYEMALKRSKAYFGVYVGLARIQIVLDDKKVPEQSRKLFQLCFDETNMQDSSSGFYWLMSEIHYNNIDTEEQYAAKWIFKNIFEERKRLPFNGCNNFEDFVNYYQVNGVDLFRFKIEDLEGSEL